MRGLHRIHRLGLVFAVATALAQGQAHAGWGKSSGKSSGGTHAASAPAMHTSSSPGSGGRSTAHEATPVSGSMPAKTPHAATSPEVHPATPAEVHPAIPRSTYPSPPGTLKLYGNISEPAPPVPVEKVIIIERQPGEGPPPVRTFHLGQGSRPRVLKTLNCAVGEAPCGMQCYDPASGAHCDHGVVCDRDQVACGGGCYNPQYEICHP